MLITVSALVLTLQVPLAWALDPAQNVVRRVHEGPFEGRTMLWVRLAPTAKDPGISPSSLMLVAEFKGKQPRTRPGVTLHAETNVRFYPLITRVPRLVVTIDHNPPIDFLAPGEAASVGYCCGDAPIPTSVAAELSAIRLDLLARASSVSGDILGVPFTLDSTQLKALAEFRRSILPGSR